MKQLLALIVLVVVFGLAAFLYRYEIERPAGIHIPPSGSATSTPHVACTAEAKICPDGSAVGRSGPSCSFTACPSPNVELTSGSTTLAFVLPSGYAVNTNALGSDQTLIAAYERASKSADAPHAIVVRMYPIPAGETAQQVMIENTMFESSGMTATSTNQFKQTTIQGKTFYTVDIERFEGQIHSAYYLLGSNDVLRFEVLERDVMDWSDQNLVVSSLPQHQALVQMLSTLQVQGL